jgi:hypothetical protein
LIIDDGECDREGTVLGELPSVCQANLLQAFENPRRVIPFGEVCKEQTRKLFVVDPFDEDLLVQTISDSSVGRIAQVGRQEPAQELG